MNYIYFVVIGRLSLLKLYEFQDIEMTYEEYIKYLLDLKSKKEIYLLEKVLKINNSNLSIESLLHFKQFIKVYFLIKINKELKNNIITFPQIEDYINKYQLKFDDYKYNLFMLSFYSMKNEDIKCEKCKSTINKTLICNNDQNSPKFLLINCIWNNAKPNLENVINFFFLISLKEELDNLFICPNKVEKDYYYLNGIIFYSYTLCHYINMTFNIEKKIFTLYNDEGIIEFNEIIELFKYLTLEQLKSNNKTFFYPVLLVYGKENIYDETMINSFNKIDFNYYNKFIDECEGQIKKKEKKEIIKEKPLTKEEKEKNYQELIRAQIKFNLEQKYEKPGDDVFSFLRNKDRDLHSEIPKMNFIDNNEQKKIKSNNFLQSNNKKVNKSASVDKKFSVGTKGNFNNVIKNINKIYNPYNNNSRKTNFNWQKGIEYPYNEWDYDFKYH
jgi:hypothetical protein